MCCLRRTSSDPDIKSLFRKQRCIHHDSSTFINHEKPHFSFQIYMQHFGLLFNTWKCVHAEEYRFIIGWGFFCKFACTYFFNFQVATHFPPEWRSLKMAQVCIVCVLKAGKISDLFHNVQNSVLSFRDIHSFANIPQAMLSHLLQTPGNETVHK